MSDFNFKELGIRSEILNAVDEMGFEVPTTIQGRCIPKILNGSDVVGQAQTGTGKTAAFGIPAIQLADRNSGLPSVLVLCPTRELAVQVTGEVIQLAKFTEGIYSVPIYGGQPINRQLKALKRGAQIVVGTPGRVIDHLKRGTLKLDHLKMVVLDEADEMLNMGFRDDLETILGYSNGQSQKVMFSATIPKSIEQIMNRWMNNPEVIKVKGQAETAEGIEQFVMEVRDSVRTEAVARVMDAEQVNLALIFCNTKRLCKKLVKELQARGYGSDSLHGDLRQNARDKVMRKFRNGNIDILVATDVAARGLDVENVDIVFNYDIPQDPEYYVHRIGRTGRAGKTGKAVTFFSGNKKRKQIRYIEKIIRTRLSTLPMPSDREVLTNKVDNHITELVNTLERGGLREYIEQLEPIVGHDYSMSEIAAALLKMKIHGEKPSKKLRPA